MVTAQELADFLGRGDDTELVTLAGEHLPVIHAFISAYTRGNGFTNGEPNEAINAVIKTTAARLVTNPEQGKRYSIGDYTESPGVLNGFTLPELFVLNSYRKRTA